MFRLAGLRRVQQCPSESIDSRIYDALCRLSKVMAEKLQQGPGSPSQTSISGYKEALMHRPPRSGDKAFKALNALAKKAAIASLDST